MRFFCRRMFRWVAVVVAIVVVLLILFRSRYNEPIRTLAQTQITNATSDLINDAIDRQIEAGDIHYDRIVYFEKDLNGRITALKTNMSEVNRLKTSTLNLINDEILALDTTDIGIPLGSLFISELFSGKGPIIPVEIISIRNSDAYFTSNFSQAGINQTLHRITLELTGTVRIVLPGRAYAVTVTARAPVAENVIVGDVPDAYTNVANEDDLLNLVPGT